MEDEILQKERELERELKKEENQLQMLTPHIAIRGNDFYLLIKNILINKGKIKDHYADLLLDKDAMKIYENAFTSNTITSYKKEDGDKIQIVEDENSKDNYDIYKIFGENMFENFMSWYIFKKFPSLKSASDVKTIARIKINHSPKIEFPIIAEELGFLPYISSSLYEYNVNKQKLLQNTFSAFLGATAYILDNKLKNGIGYAISYDILKNIFDKKEINLPSKFEELNDPITTLKQQYFDLNKRLGFLYDCNYDKDARINYCSVYQVEGGGGPQKNEGGIRTLLGEGSSNIKKKIAEKNAALNALNFLDSKGLLVEKREKIKYKEPLKETIKYGIRGQPFKNFIKTLIDKGNINKEYSNILLSDENLKIYSNAFTSNTANLDTYLVQDENSTDNYEIFETLGDAVFKNFIPFYTYRRFPYLISSKDVKIIARVKINYGSKNSFYPIAEKLGFFPFITSSVYEHNTNKINLLEDTFEAFFGATTYILDNNFKNGVGYSVSYDILKGIFDDISISTEFEQLNDPISILKEFFDKNKDYGTIEYVCNKIGINQYCDVVLTTSDGNKIILGNGVSTKKPNAKENAAINSIEYLKKKGYKI